MRIQSYHEDRKDAIVKLDELIKRNYRTYPQFRNAVNEFLDSSSGLFLPAILKTELRGQLIAIDGYLQERQFEIYGEPDEDPNAEEEYKSWFNDLSPDQQLDIEIERRLSALKSAMTRKIEEHITDE